MALSCCCLAVRLPAHTVAWFARPSPRTRSGLCVLRPPGGGAILCPGWTGSDRTCSRPRWAETRPAAIRYITNNAAKWRALPADFPPYQTVFGFFSRWARAGIFNRIRDELRRAIRLRVGRCPNPTATPPGNCWAGRRPPSRLANG
ncbi:transposase [Nonomuraea sp. NPDC046802]|uniref:transposase n=1 Tax=Nonomuraea sp. NPDC046802 TaxID=3154919 RepID=UPI0033C09EB3